MNRLLIDTNIYIDYLNGDKYKQVVFVGDYPKRLWLSSVVLMELYAGAFSHRSVALIDTIRKPFEARRMILIPTVHDYILAGSVLARLQKEKGYNLKKKLSLTNDVLIALTTRRIGATLVTQNKRDFEVIKTVIDFNLETVE